MKKIITLLVLTILISSCGSMEKNEGTEMEVDTVVVENNMDKEDNIDLTPDEEKIVEELLK